MNIATNQLIGNFVPFFINMNIHAASWLRQEIFFLQIEILETLKQATAGS